jgi:hypothetical protein
VPPLVSKKTVRESTEPEPELEPEPEEESAAGMAGCSSAMLLTTLSENLCSMAASSARVAFPCGSKSIPLSPGSPVMMPIMLHHIAPSRAQSEILSLSAKSELPVTSPAGSFPISRAYLSRIAAVCSRVTLLSGAKRLPPTPPVIPFAAAHATALPYHEPSGTSVKALCKPEASGLPARRYRTVTSIARDTGISGLNSIGSVPVPVIRPLV